MYEDESMLELLEIYMDIVEKQDEMIYRLGKVVKRQREDLALLQNDAKFSDEKLEQDIAIIRETGEECQQIKRGLDAYKP